MLAKPNWLAATRLGVKWEYKFDPAAVRDLRAVGPSVAREIRAFLDKRILGAIDPRQFGKPLRGAKHGLWRYRVQDYRVICRIEDAVVTVVVVAIGHRSTVYGE
jgi:mRNA interferase RelE/StbE